MSENLTPMMRQYHEIKRRLPGKLIFFRLGDFYEMFFEDAVLASRELEITLTSRNRDKHGTPIPMCGVPHHAVDGYIAKLIKRGHKVAVCEQLEEPRPGVLVKREVVRVVTPGTVTEELMLEPKDNNFLACVIQRGDGFGAAFLDISTGDFLATQCHGDDLEARLIVECNHFQPAEILYPKANASLFRDSALRAVLEQATGSELEDWVFQADFAGRTILSGLQASCLDGYGLNGRDLAVSAAGALLYYVRESNKLSLENISSLQYFESTDYLRLDTESVANLELVKSVDGTKKLSLLNFLDFTRTNMGGRLLKNWVLRPLLDLDQIRQRQEGIAELAGNYRLREKIAECLRPIQDVERLLGKITAGIVRPRDMLAMKASLEQFPLLLEILPELKSPLFRRLSDGFDPLADIRELLEAGIHEDPPPTVNECGIIRDGYRPELDELRELSRGGKDFIARIEVRERTRTGISSLKVGYNRVFGYYIEISRTNLKLAPDDYIRKQTLANAERFITQELKEYEEKILSAEEQMLRLEKELFLEIRRRIAAAAVRLSRSARTIAQVDVLCSLAEAAVRHRYTRPEVVADTGIEIQQGRHPIIEHIEDSFVPNDTRLDPDSHQIIILTGPNMGGKSTYLRQVALIVILAQMGSFVPAATASIGLVDQIFTRVGASDNLARGRSTFMVEMIETAGILNSCTPRSLILLDEVGRGTATFDGLSIAWSVAEYLHGTTQHRALTLFATHYHELTRLPDLYPGIQNYCVTVKEGLGDIIFLRRVVAGSASRSYGIEVARLAGMPRTVVQRAGEILKKLEKKEIDLTGGRRDRNGTLDPSDSQKRLF